MSSTNEILLALCWLLFALAMSFKSEHVSSTINPTFCLLFSPLEETCSLLNQQENIDLPLRIEKACEPNVDYGTDRNPQAKAHQYVSQRKCQEALNLKLDNDYLIWGLSSDLWHIKDEISYLITKNTWIERWPNEDECQDEEFQNLCDDFAQLHNILTIFGCPN